ncbi:Shikimate transporter shiA, MFS superfamily [Janthinobacterium sp. Marseille]|uniref:MFS transporter n=1 Tax=Herminiimonas aquatilis TaxID=345342 RepID=A0ABW2J6T0_9BURK|nr:MFS transporter [Janthinobacterium sp. Marseille]ABR90826.1 Shikimate transporter shiA, MFS superfamily [Janthinobacterium sp. Marseille]
MAFNASATASTVNPRAEKQKIRSVVFASAIGTIIEWYDFLIYGMAAALVFNKLFFPNIDPLLGTLAALGSYAVGFLARPLGGAIFGHYGDRIGRKSILMITLALMGIGTFLIGLLPTYGQIGIWAPILLITLRIIQGIGLGGEWGGAAVMVLEHSPKNRRGFYGSLVQVGFPLGLVIATLVFSFVSKMPEADILSWGWRIPFLLSAVLIIVGIFIRKNVEESPVFEDMKMRKALSKSPVMDVILKHPRTFFIAIGLKISEVSWVYMLTVFMVVYATTTLGLPKSLILEAILIAAMVEIVTIPLFGYLSDVIGRRPLYFIGALFTIAFAFPLFLFMEMRTPEAVILTVVVAMSMGHGLMFAPEATYFPELFGANVRYSGASFGFQVAAAIGGGLSPIIATALAGYLGGTAGVSIMLILLALITLTAAFFARETKNEALLK